MAIFRHYGLDSVSDLVYSPDPLLRYQFGKVHDVNAGFHDAAPLKRLMLAVLENGIECFQIYFFNPSRRRQRLSREAEEWIASDAEGPFSFGDVCESLGIDPGWLRRELFRWKETQLRRAAEEGQNTVPLTNLSTRGKYRGTRRAAI